MNRTAVCTISTQSHIFKSKVLLQSVRNYSKADLFCLLTDGNDLPQPVRDEIYHPLSVLTKSPAPEIIEKYKGNALRWSCKSLYMMYLLSIGYDKVIYVDNDICFFSSPDFLFEELDTAAIILTPHFYPVDTYNEQNWLEANYRVGLYNAGFIGASLKGLPALEWWASCCLYNVKKSAWRGLFDDQKYLDLMPVIFDDVKVLKHKGCNVAGWNIEQCPRSIRNGELLIADKWPIIFIHFTTLTIGNILSGKDSELSEYLKIYIDELQKLKPQYSVNTELKRKFKDYLLYFRHIKWRVTRFFE